MSDDRITRDDLGLLLALTWSRRGTCIRRKVGCVLFDAEGIEIGSGYNGPASGEPHCTAEPCAGAKCPPGTGLELCEAIHAEANALLRCRDITRIHTAYVTHSPCLDCVKLLKNTSCMRIVFIHRYAHDEPAMKRWVNSTMNGVLLGRTWEQGDSPI